MTATTLFTIASVVCIAFCARMIWRDLRRPIVPFSKGQSDEA
jgi:hypothetical protein